MTFPKSVLDDGPPATELDIDRPLDDAGAEWEYDPTEWIVIAESETRVRLLRESTIEDRAGHRTHEFAVLATDLPFGEPWGLGAHGLCALRIDLGGLMPATVDLSPSYRPAPGDTDVELFVTENACHSGKDATGRVELFAVEGTANTVELMIGVRPDTSADGWSCPSNPPTPFTVTLDDPIGDRSLVDGGVYPKRELTPYEGP